MFLSDNRARVLSILRAILAVSLDMIMRFLTVKNFMATYYPKDGSILLSYYAIDSTYVCRHSKLERSCGVASDVQTYEYRHIGESRGIFTSWHIAGTISGIQPSRRQTFKNQPSQCEVDKEVR